MPDGVSLHRGAGPAFVAINRVPLRKDHFRNALNCQAPELTESVIVE
jgi:hypothetical protein